MISSPFHLSFWVSDEVMKWTLRSTTRCLWEREVFFMPRVFRGRSRSASDRRAVSTSSFTATASKKNPTLITQPEVNCSLICNFIVLGGYLAGKIEEVCAASVTGWRPGATLWFLRRADDFFKSNVRNNRLDYHKIKQSPLIKIKVNFLLKNSKPEQTVSEQKWFEWLDDEKSFI